jgi:hypothetical protein
VHSGECEGLVRSRACACSCSAGPRGGTRAVLEALGWGLLAQSSLLLAGLLVCWVTMPTKAVGILGGFGAGAMIAAVSFDLLPEAQAHIEPWQTGVWMMLGVVVFLVADRFVERRFGAAGPGAAMSIVVGSVVDGVPESAIVGIQVGTGFTISLTSVARSSSRTSRKQLRPLLISWRADGAATARPALVGRRPRLRSRGRPRVSGDRRDGCRAGRPCRCSRRRGERCSRTH